MVNCNPETVSTDYDTSDRLYFEPLRVEEVLAVCEREQPVGRRDPVRRPDAAQARARARGAPAGRSSARRSTRSTSPRTASASRALCDELGVRVPAWGMACGADEAAAVAERIGYPVLVRPSYVLGGRNMVVCYDEETVRRRRARRRAGARRPLPRERGRDRRRRGLRRRGHVGRGRDAARRGGRRPLGRLVLRAARAGRLGGDARRDPRRRPPARRARSASSGCSTSSSRSPTARSSCSR